MGLDSIEILIKVEETFSVKIPDREAEQIITVGDFHNVVWQYLAGRYSDKCKSQGIFYKLRRSSAEVFSFSEKRFSLETCPEEIFPGNDRRHHYLNFARITGLELPGLELRRPWDIVLTTFAIAAVAGTFGLSLILINFFDFSNWMLLTPVAGVFSTIILSDILEPKRTVISAPSIRMFTQKTLALNYTRPASETGTNRTEMETVMNHIIADMAGLELEEVTPEKKISDDLGID